MTPPPGSDEAVASGCRCAVLDNGHGKGSGYTDAGGAPLYWISADCPLHGSTLEGTVQVTGRGQ
jgi:hypothetical protein